MKRSIYPESSSADRISHEPRLERAGDAPAGGAGELGSLRRELFSRFIATLFTAQIALLLIGGTFAFLTLQSQHREQVKVRAEKAAELFALLARYGDVRYARFAVIAAGEGDGLAAFHVLDSGGQEIQAQDPGNPARIPESVVEASRSILTSLEATGTQVRIIDENANGGSGNFVHLVRTPDGAAYLLVSRLIEPDSRWMTAGAMVLCGLIASSLVAAIFAARRLRRVVGSLEAYAKQVRKLDIDRRFCATAPFVELLPLQQSISELAQSLREQTRMAAIASMTQILAHDVRKPFSILRIVLGMLQSADDMDKVRRVLNRAVPDAEKALASVNGLISDVMEVGSTSTTLIQEATSPGALIDSALSEIFRIYPQSNVSIDYDFQHTSMVKVHVDKIARVFSNIIGNALEAMDFRGRIWFQTKEYGEVIEFCLGNSGSIIPLESQPKLFEAFFTGGKKGGTGLGLAIAHKLVTAHGGRIWCESARTPEHPRGFVEFRFTLPSIKGVASTWLKVLPTHSRDVTSSLKLKTNGDDTSSESELHLVNAIAEASQAIGRPLRILLIDDEAVYCRVLIDQVLFSERLRDVCLIEQAANSSEVLALDSTNCDLVITDLDLGHDSRNGFDLVGDLRRQGLRGFVCIHSNRIVAEDHKCALDSGADAFLPKPMSRMHFLKLILQATQRAVALRSPVFKVTQDESTRTDLRKSIECRFADKNVGQEEVEPHDRAKVLDDGVKSVIVVDDDVFLLEAWRQVLTGFSVLTYARPADLFADIESGVVQAASTKAVVTDFHFENEPTITGAVLARRLAAKGFGRIVAATDAMIESDDRRLFVEVVTKDEIAFGFDVARVVG